MAIARIPWFHRRRRSGPEPALEVPLLGPRPRSARHRLVRALVLQQADEVARRRLRGRPRRDARSRARELARAALPGARARQPRGDAQRPDRASAAGDGPPRGRAAQWTTYTGWSPSPGGGYLLDDEPGLRTLREGLDLGVPIFGVYKGGARGLYTPSFCQPQDVGPAARASDATIVVYGSAFEAGSDGRSALPPEGAYDESLEATSDASALDRGVNGLIRSLRAAGIGPNGQQDDGGTAHVYAECGGAFAHMLQSRREEAMHFFGKLLKYVGEDRVVWGSECLRFGSPAPLIAAFKAFEISQQLQERHGYPALTPERKRKILGLNARTLLQRNARLSLPGTCHSDYATEARG